jgi:hypothetical protein
MESHVALLAPVQGQPLVVETVALAGPPTAAMFCVVGDNV